MSRYRDGYFNVGSRTHGLVETQCFASLLRQKKVSKEKATPTGPVALRLPCDARRSGPARNSLTGFAQTTAPDDSRPVCASRRPQRGTAGAAQRLGTFHRLNHTAMQTTGRLLGFPFGAAEKRRALRGCRRALSEGAQRPSCAAAEESEHRREVALATGPVGVAFFWLLFLAKQEK